MAKGNFIDYVVSDDPNKYPNDGVQSGYYYETVDDVTPEVTAQTPVITQILEGLVGKAQGANATADKILEGYSAYVGQELLHGTAKEGIPLPSGFTKYAVDKFTPTSDQAVNATYIPHSLGEIPKLAIISANPSDITDAGNYYPYLMVVPRGISSDAGYASGAMIVSKTYSVFSEYDIKSTFNNLQVLVGRVLASYLYQAGVEYTLITMA